MTTNARVRTNLRNRLNEANNSFFQGSSNEPRVNGFRTSPYNLLREGINFEKYFFSPVVYTDMASEKKNRDFRNANYEKPP